MKRKVDILLMVMFLFGSMIFLCPIFGQIKEVEEDDRVYTRMSAEVKPPQQRMRHPPRQPPRRLCCPCCWKCRRQRKPLCPLPRRPPHTRLLPTLPRQHRQSGQQIPAVSM